MEAWSIGRSMPHAASLIFGMESRVSSAIADLSVPELDRRERLRPAAVGL
jgi:hypothetical protein